MHVAASAGYHHVVIVLIQYDADPTFLNQVTPQYGILSSFSYIHDTQTNTVGKFIHWWWWGTYKSSGRSIQLKFRFS